MLSAAEALAQDFRWAAALRKARPLLRLVHRQPPELELLLPPLPQLRSKAQSLRVPIRI
jgi:hypothetical protein